VKLCPNGHENPDDADFCVECGESLRWDETSIWRVPTQQSAGEAAGAQAGVPPTPPVAATPEEPAAGRARARPDSRPAAAARTRKWL